MLTVLLAELESLHGRFSDTWLKRLGRASVSQAPGWILDGFGQRLRIANWPLVEATYRLDTGNAPSGESSWLRLDPASALPDINGVRMMAYGSMLGVTAQERDALLADLAPLFEEAGAELHWPQPHRAYLELPGSPELPSFTATSAALGEDLLEHLPGESSREPQTRLWRRVLTDVQMALHTHPVNVARAQRGLPAINLMWPWRPADPVVSDLALRSDVRLVSPDEEWLGIWQWAGGQSGLRPGDASELDAGESTLLDLRDVLRCSQLEREWLDPLFTRCGGSLQLQFDDTVYTLRPADRFKFWKGALAQK